jgi:hypothetical protein
MLSIRTINVSIYHHIEKVKKLRENVRRETVIVSGCRTAAGNFGGGLKSQTAMQLGAVVMVERNRAYINVYWWRHGRGNVD